MKNLKEFSKWAVRAMVWLWIAGAIYGAVVVLVELVALLVMLASPDPNAYTVAPTVHLPELLTYIGVPMGAGLVAYLLKSAFENKEKIKQNPDYLISPDNFGGNNE